MGLYRRHGVVVIGAGAAGVSVAEALREGGYDGRLTLLGDEPHPPYDRPPLSKGLLSGALEPEAVWLRAPQEYAALGVELRVGERAASVDPAARRVALAGGGLLAYDALVVATGIRPRRLGPGPGPELDGVHVLRRLDDALALRAALEAGGRVVVVGAGFLGCEVAATARGRGLPVTLVDPLPAPMYRAFGAQIGALAAAVHTEHGVRVRTGIGVAGLTGTAGRVTGVALRDGTVEPADVVLVAIGSVPATQWLAGSGIPVADGVVCDALGRAATDVYAAGDVAACPPAGGGPPRRVEHRTNATEQARVVAAGLLGAPRPEAVAPYVWTNQFDARIQAYGEFPAGAEVRMWSGSVRERRFVAVYHDGGRAVGALGWNDPRGLRAAARTLAGPEALRRT